MVRTKRQLVKSRSEATTEDPLLSPQRAFVLQFYPEADVEQGCLVGRVEHVVSAQAIRFDSLDALMRFLGRVLTEVRTAPSEPK